MGDREFSDIQIFQHSGKGIPLFITGHKKLPASRLFVGNGSLSYKKIIYRAAVSQKLRNTGLQLLRKILPDLVTGKQERTLRLTFPTHGTPRTLGSAGGLRYTPQNALKFYNPLWWYFVNN
jgi:hypothetical protein